MRPADPNLLVGFDTADDAAVYRLRDDLAIVVTTDFFTPIVDDPFDWGRIAATNALSDVYAMGGTPLLALNLVAWPREGLPFELLARVLDGGAAIAARRGLPHRGRPLHRRRRAEVRTRGGRHGRPDAGAHQCRGAQAGDALVLTKPIGLGVISTAVKRDARPNPTLDAAAIEVMTTLERDARVTPRSRSACTRPPTSPASVCSATCARCSSRRASRAVVDCARCPVIDGVRALLAAGMVAGGTQRNHAFVAPDVDFGGLPETSSSCSPTRRHRAACCSRSPPSDAGQLVAALEARGTLAAAVIGRTTGSRAVRADDQPGRVQIR